MIAAFFNGLARAGFERALPEVQERRGILQSQHEFLRRRAQPVGIDASQVADIDDRLKPVDAALHGRVERPVARLDG
jgi:hypothetical protein